MLNQSASQVCSTPNVKSDFPYTSLLHCNLFFFLLVFQRSGANRVQHHIRRYLCSCERGSVKIWCVKYGNVPEDLCRATPCWPYVFHHFSDTFLSRPRFDLMRLVRSRLVQFPYTPLYNPRFHIVILYTFFGAPLIKIPYIFIMYPRPNFILYCFISRVRKFPEISRDC